ARRPEPARRNDAAGISPALRSMHVRSGIVDPPLGQHGHPQSPHGAVHRLGFAARPRHHDGPTSRLRMVTATAERTACIEKMTRKLVLLTLATLAVSASLFAETGRYMVVMRRSTPATSLRLVANSAESI